MYVLLVKKTAQLYQYHFLKSFPVKILIKISYMFSTHFQKRCLMSVFCAENDDEFMHCKFKIMK